MPGYSSGVWEGKKEGERIVLQNQPRGPEGQKRVSRLTFSNIRADGYDWVAETVIEGDKENPRAGWRSSCQRRR